MKYVIVLSFIAADIITGVVKALYHEGLNSTVLRRGLYHKLAEILALGVGVALDCGITYFSLGLPAQIYTSFGCYISAMELISIIENLCDINPTLKALFKPYLEKLKGTKDGDKDE